MSNPDITIWTIFWTIVVLMLYFIPAIHAASRHHRNRSAIAWTNFFFGWTVLGWIICFIWANTANTEPKTTYL